MTKIRSYALTHGPFDGLLGFSQGAGIAGLIAKHPNAMGMLGLRFAMIVSGYKLEPDSALQWEVLEPWRQEAEEGEWGWPKKK